MTNMKRFNAVAATAVLALLLALLPGRGSISASEWQPGAPDSGDDATMTTTSPDFSAIDDPLAGNYTVFSVDDLVIQRPVAAGGQTTITNYVLLTDNNAVASSEQVNLLTADCTINGNWPQQVSVGRFFALDRDVTVTLHPTGAAAGTACSGTGNTALTIHPQAGPAGAVSTSFQTSSILRTMTMGDFNLDGFEDVFILNNSQAFVATATDVTDVGGGMVLGPRLTVTSSVASSHAPVSGDFNDDGLPDVAWLDQSSNVNFATVCPGPRPGTVCAGAAALQVILNPLKAQDNPIHVATEGNCAGPANARSLAAGNFSGAGGDDLATVYQGSDCRVGVSWYRFNGEFEATNNQPVDTASIGPQFVDDLLATAGPVYWFGENDQLVVAYVAVTDEGCNDGDDDLDARAVEHVAVVNFANNQMTSSATAGRAGDCRFFLGETQKLLNGLAIGHFAPIEEEGDEAQFNLQIATLINENKGIVRIYAVDAPTNYTPALLSENDLTTGPGTRSDSTALEANWLTAGDIQGRSARLGPPTIVRVTSHSQPSVILGSPPMHVDYVAPDESTAPGSDLVNFTVVPDAYNAQYALTATDSDQSSNTDTTSYSYGYSESTEEKFSVGVPLVSAVSGSFKQAWEQTYERTSEDYTYTQDEFRYDASTVTGLGDQIWYADSELNVYYYPVLGQTICPNEQSSCSSAEEQPLIVQFSGPNTSSVVSAPGSTTEWYQPVHEPGQLFSYPWTQAQLADRLGQEMQLLSSSLPFFTDDSLSSQLVEWSTGSGQSQSAGTTNTHSFETSNSLTGGSIPDEGSGLEVTGSFDYNNSAATGTLNTSTSDIGESKGVTIAKTNTFQDSGLYRYRVEPFIFGQLPPVGTVQTITQTQPIQATGILQTAYAVNPKDNNAGSWWTSDDSPYTQYPDVALNHPARWTWDTSTNAGSEQALNCLTAADAIYDCVDIKDPLPNNLWNSAFYWMRGLLVTIGGATGPQRNMAVVGDDIFLQARVYNYSLKDMAADSVIKVRFYRQEIVGTTPTGDSVLISEQTIAPLPGFNSDTQPDTPNWTTATASFAATADMADKYYLFWVLVWAEDGANNMLTELPGHGLSAKPGALASIADVPLEQVTIAPGGDSSRTTSFSNNAGYLHLKFYIAGDSSGLRSNAAARTAQLSIENAAATPQTAEVGQEVSIAADIVAAGAAAHGVTIHFHDGPPEEGGPLLDVESLPYIRAGESDHLSIPYRATGCGTHTIVIVVNPGRDSEVRSSAGLVVSCAHYLPVVGGR